MDQGPAIPNLPLDADGNVLLQNPDGEVVSVAPHEAQDSIVKGGYKPADIGAIQQIDKEAKYGSAGQQVITGLEGAADAASFGISTGIERMLGVRPKDIDARRELNPTSHAVGQVAGLVGSAFIPGGAEFEAANLASKEAIAAVKAGNLTKEAAAPIIQTAKEAINPFSASSVMGGLGERAAKSMGLNTGLVGDSAHAAVKLALENAMFQSGDEASKWLANDPDQTIDTAAANVGFAALIGGGLGGALGAVSPLWEASKGSGVSKWIQDVKARGKEYLSIPDRVGTLSQELTERHAQDSSIIDETYGAKGIKAQAISKLIPKQTSDLMIGQSQDALQAGNSLLEDMAKDERLYPPHLVAKFERAHQIFSENLKNAVQPEQIFNAMNDYKSRIQDMADFGFIKKTDIAADFNKAIKSIGLELRQGLEDPEIWGEAGEVQQSINKAAHEYIFKDSSPLKQFEGAFTENLNGERVLSPSKIQSYDNLTGKAGQVIRQQKLGNWLEASDKFRNAVNDAFEKMGQESPFPESPMTYTRSTIGELTPGARFMDAFVKKGLSRLGGETIAGGIGATAGAVVGHPFLGALLGEHTLGAFFNSILPSLVKPILERGANAAGVKSAVDVAGNALKGEALLNKASKAVFQATSAVIPQAFQVSDKHIEKLDNRLKALQQNPNDLMNIGGKLAHYAPAHATALAKKAISGVSVLNNLRPTPMKRAPLDSEPVVPHQHKAEFRNALEIAQNPLGLLSKVKDGTIRSHEVELMKQIYPALYQKTGQKLIQEMTDHLSKDGKIPYERRLGLSTFLGQPMDSTMTPQSIQAHQIANQMNLAPSQQNTMVKPSKSSPALGKMADSSMTSGQRAESRHLK